MNRTLFPIALILISIALFYWWINPRYEVVKLLSAQLKDSNSALEQAAVLNSLKADLEKKEVAIDKGNIEKLQKFLPDNIDNIRLFLDIQGVAARYGASIQDISVEGQGQKTSGTQSIGPSGKKYGQMALSFSVNTSYDNLGKFLKDLEKSLRLVEIKSISFAVDDKEPDRYKVSISINAFWLNPKTISAVTS